MIIKWNLLKWSATDSSHDERFVRFGAVLERRSHGSQNPIEDEFAGDRPKLSARPGKGIRKDTNVQNWQTEVSTVKYKSAYDSSQASGSSN